MRANGKDIVELFGFAPDDISNVALETFQSGQCPFIRAKCTKGNHDQTIVYGVCSVTNGIKSGKHNEVIVCPKRFYQENYNVLKGIAHDVWGGSITFIAGGSLAQLREKCLVSGRSVVAFGQGSGTEVTVQSNGRMSMDWVLQDYKIEDNSLIPQTFVGVEVQSIDITGNYRENWDYYKRQKDNLEQEFSNEAIVPQSGHSLNWANVHKRLIPQIIRKGNIYRRLERCTGFYFIVPEIVFQKFEEVIGPLPLQSAPSRNNLSIKTYSLDSNVREGKHRMLRNVKTVHLDLVSIANAFINNVGEDTPSNLDNALLNLI